MAEKAKPPLWPRGVATFRAEKVSECSYIWRLNKKERDCNFAKQKYPCRLLSFECHGIF